MAEYRYTQNTGNLKKFLDHIQSAGVPDKVTQKYLEQCGYKSTNDRTMIGVLKGIGFLDTNGAPTEKWKKYRDKKKAPAVMAAAVREAYSELFATYPEAYKRDEEALRNFFSANTNLGAKAIGLTVNTFRALCDAANFDSTEPSENEPHARHAPASTVPLSRVSSSKSGLTVNINVELTIPATEKEEVYDNFFGAMKKHLFSDE